jgi:hypothetical protein
MGSSGREGIQRDFDELDAVVSRVLGHSFDALTTPERLNLLERLERETRRLRAPGHELINQLAEQAGPEELGSPLPHALADRLRITRGEARRRVAEAAELGPRRALTAELLAALLTATAAAQRAGDIDPAHVAVIRR